MALKRRRANLTGISEINMTPLIDLTFVLLIIFFLTTPAMIENSFNITPPTMNAEEVDSKIESCIVNVDASGNIFLDEVAVSEAQLLDDLSRRALADPGLIIYVRGDRDATYGSVVNAFDAIRRAGYQQVKLLTVKDQSR